MKLITSLSSNTREWGKEGGGRRTELLLIKGSYSREGGGGQVCITEKLRPQWCTQCDDIALLYIW